MTKMMKIRKREASDGRSQKPNQGFKSSFRHIKVTIPNGICKVYDIIREPFSLIESFIKIWPPSAHCRLRKPASLRLLSAADRQTHTNAVAIVHCQALRATWPQLWSRLFQDPIQELISHCTGFVNIFISFVAVFSVSFTFCLLQFCSSFSS